MVPRISPDGKRVALMVGGDVWIYHTDRAAADQGDLRQRRHADLERRRPQARL